MYHVMYCNVIRSKFVAIYQYKYTRNFVESKLDIVMILHVYHLPQMVPFPIADQVRY